MKFSLPYSILMLNKLLYFSGLYYRHNLKSVTLPNSKLEKILQQRSKGSRNQVLIKPLEPNNSPKWMDLETFLSE